MRHSAAAASLLFFLLSVSSGQAFAQLNEQAFAQDNEGDTEKAPWRGSSITYRNVATALSVDKDAELTYNPYYAMSLSVSPRWWFGDHVAVFAGIDLSRELTHSDSTTYEGEYVWSDLRAGVAFSRYLTIPVLDIALSSNLNFSAPTSKYSRARTMYTSIRPDLILTRGFDVLGGIGLMYGVMGTKFFHEFTTSEKSESLIPGCTGVECAAFMNTGVRNTEWRMTHVVGLSVDFTEWIGLSTSVAWVMDFLYEIESADTGVSWEPQSPTDNRYMMVYGIELYAKPMDSLTLALGASTINAQQKADSSMQTPYFNRYTNVYFDMKFDIAGFVSQLSSAEEE
jgi:hypothetical protein